MRARAVHGAVVGEGVEVVRLVEPAQRGRDRSGPCVEWSTAESQAASAARRGVARAARGGTVARSRGSRPSPRRPRPGRPRRRRRATGRTSRVRRIRDAEDPDFAVAYERLWGEFGARGEMETARGDPRAAGVGSRHVPSAARGARLRAARAAPRGEPSRRCATTPPWCASTRAGGRLPAPSWCTSRTRFVEPAHRGSGLAAWLRALPLQTARRCAAAAGCAPGTPIVLVAEMEPPDPAEPAAMAAAALLRARRLPEGRSERGALRAAGLPPARGAGAAPRPSRCRSASCCAASGARARSAMPAAEVAAVVEAIYAVYAVHVPARGARPAARRRGALDRSRGELPPATTHRVITAYHHPGFAAPIGDHVMPMRKFQLVADGLAGRAGVRVEAPAPVDARRPAARAHAPRTSRPCAAASRARSPSRRSSRGRRRSGRRCCSPTAARSPRPARALDDGVAAALASGFHHAHADHGEGFCTFNGLVVAAEALRAAGRVRTVAVLDLDLHYGNGTASLCAHAALALQLLDLRQRLLAEQALPRRRERAPRGRTEPRVVRAPERQRPRRRCSRRSSAARAAILAFGPARPRALPGRRRPLPRGPVLAARPRPRRPARARPAASSRWAQARGAPARLGARGRLHAGRLEGRGRARRHLRRGRKPCTAAAVTLVRRLFATWTGFVFLFFYLPIAILILFSFNQSKLNIVWTGFTLEWYAALWRDTVLVRTLKNSLIVATATTLVSVVLGTAGGWLLYRYRYRGERLARDAGLPADDRARGDPRREPADPVRHDRPPARLHDHRDLPRHLLLPLRDGRGAGAPRGPRSRRSRRRRSTSARRRSRPSPRCSSPI